MPAPSSSRPEDASIESVWRVVSVGDGDTLRAQRGNEIISVRLACVDAPEIAQAPYGELARRYLQSQLPINSAVRLRQVDTDRYGRVVAEVFTDQNINLALVKAGYAVVYDRYVSSCSVSEYLNAEMIAQRSGLIFWSQPAPEMPWDFRRR